ncbi:uncharacterized protein si:ch211-197h24.6 isoform X4 [Chiloscyllium plagiosum]|uniref:uncharacterized protein si:ch211-197h24.6 isoform X4 n=1 Tax=Chiloscyllium plagiosum TaxID=36176 RepID=UPI001CB8414A|nr:uncharacterized protein si:ch211-197h24.6 isoform X4 [Chiloscyllium plagiosum]
MSDAVKIHQTVSDGNAAAESDADPVPAAERGIEIAEEDSSEIEHHDISNERDVTKSPENQTGVQTNSGQDEVMDETCQDQAQPNSKRDEDECSIDKVQPEAENAESEISDAEHRALVQANSDVQGVGEVQSCSNSSEKDETQSETAQVENEPIDGNETPFEVDQIENQSTSGEHDDALIEVDQVGDHFTSSEQDLVQNELGQNQANNDKTKSGTKQEKLPNDGRAAAAKTGMRKIKSTLTSGRTGKTGVLQGNRTPACIGRKKKLAIKNCRKIDKTCSDFSVGKSASSQAQIKSILAKPKSQTKNAEKGNLNVLEEADKVQPQLTVEKEPLTVETNANDINEPKNEAADMSNKDELQATTDQTWPPESTEAPASGRLPESDGFLPSKEGKPVTMFWCDICKVVCTSALNLQMHFLGFKHKKEKHHPGALKYEGEKLKPSEWKEFVFKKALEIEKLDGRGKVTVVHEKTDTKSNEKTAVKRIAETSAVEPEHKVQKSEDTSNEEIKESEEWSGMYLYPDGLPINFPVDSKPYTRPVRARQEATAPQGAVSAVDDLLSSVGSKILEDYIRNFDYEESIIGLDFVTEYHYRGKDEPYYYCELCTCELPLQCVLAHIFGLKHKMRYVRKRHPEILKLNVGKYKTIVKKKAIEIEKTDGRGRVRVIRDYNGPALSEKIAGGAMSFEDDDVESELPLVGYSFEQDQNTNMETTTSLDTRTKRSTTSSKPSNRLSCSKAGSRSDYKYSRRDSSTSRHVQSRKRESSKDTKHSGEDWRDEWQRSVKRTKYYKQDKERVKEKSIHSDRDKKRKSRSDSKDDYKKGDRSRSSKDDLHKGSSVSQRVSEKHGLSKQDIIKKEILAYLASFKVISDTDAGYVKEIMYKLSNRLLQFGQKAMKITGSAEKLIKETKSCIPDGNFGRDSHKTTNLGSYSGYSSRDKSMMESVEYSSSGSLTRSSSYHSAARNTDASIHNNLLSPSLLNSIRGMDECTITNTLTRLAANNPAFEGIRISTLVTVLMEAGVLSKRPK